VPSLRRYREMLVAFARSLAAAPPRLQAVEGGQAA
jgi:hypothetical protein